MKLWVRLEFVPEDLRTSAFAYGILDLIGEVVDVGVFSSPDLRGFVRLDVLRPFFGRRKACDEKNNEFWVRLRYEGLPPICFRCGRMGHNHGRCPDLLTPLDYELRGPWISLPTGSYRRVNPFTLQPDGPAQRPRDGFDMPRPSQLLEESLPVSRPVVARHSGALLPLPESSKRSARVIPRSQAPIGQASGSRMESLADSRRLVHSIRPRPDKRPMGEDARQYRPPPARSPASLGSVGSSTAAVPPGFGDDEAISLAIGLFLLLQTDHLVLCVKSIVMRRLYCVGLLVADVGNVGASPGPLPSIPLGPQLNPQASHPGWPFFWVFWPMLLHY
ncbi:hypothetical protein LINGRAHAP2_LOCUS7194 [Linum grandiflorum]